MKKSIRINYHYNLNDYDDKISHELREQLEEHAEARILSMRKDGYTSGELCFLDTNTDIEIFGWWDFSYTDPS